jgi:hypothetical protein
VAETSFPQFPNSTSVAEALGAASAQLSAEDLARITDAVPCGAVAGTRHDVHQMRMLNG